MSRELATHNFFFFGIDNITKAGSVINTEHYLFCDGNLNVSREQKINDVISRRLDWRRVFLALLHFSLLEKYNCAPCLNHISLYLTEHIYVSQEIMLTVWCQAERT